MSDILDKIVATKKIEVASNSKQISLANHRERAEAESQRTAFDPDDGSEPDTRMDQAFNSETARQTRSAGSV